MCSYVVCNTNDVCNPCSLHGIIKTSHMTPPYDYNQSHNHTHTHTARQTTTQETTTNRPNVTRCEDNDEHLLASQSERSESGYAHWIGSLAEQTRSEAPPDEFDSQSRTKGVACWWLYYRFGMRTGTEYRLWCTACTLSHSIVDGSIALENGQREAGSGASHWETQKNTCDQTPTERNTLHSSESGKQPHQFKTQPTLEWRTWPPNWNGIWNACCVYIFQNAHRTKLNHGCHFRLF